MYPNNPEREIYLLTIILILILSFVHFVVRPTADGKCNPKDGEMCPLPPRPQLLMNTPACPPGEFLGDGWTEEEKVEIYATALDSCRTYYGPGYCPVKLTRNEIKDFTVLCGRR